MFPPQNTTLVGSDTVCGLRYEAANNTDECPTDYNMFTYKNTDEAKSDGAVVTHTGACGVCSTTQDLAAYMRTPDILTATKHCSKLSLLRGNSRENCLAEIGLSKACSELWLHRWNAVFVNCLLECTESMLRDEPSNTGPQCELNDCVQCNEDTVGEVFTQVAGRTRRRSGLLSTEARLCEEISPVIHQSCPMVNVTLAEQRSVEN